MTQLKALKKRFMEDPEFAEEPGRVDEEHGLVEALVGAAGEGAAARVGAAWLARDGAVEGRCARVGGREQDLAGVVGGGAAAAGVDADRAEAAVDGCGRGCRALQGHVQRVARRSGAWVPFDGADQADCLHGRVGVQRLAELGAELDAVRATCGVADPVAVDRVFPAGPGGPAADGAPKHRERLRGAAAAEYVVERAAEFGDRDPEHGVRGIGGAEFAQGLGEEAGGVDVAGVAHEAVGVLGIGAAPEVVGVRVPVRRMAQERARVMAAKAAVEGRERVGEVGERAEAVVEPAVLAGVAEAGRGDQRAGGDVSHGWGEAAGIVRWSLPRAERFGVWELEVCKACGSLKLSQTANISCVAHVGVGMRMRGRAYDTG